MAQFTASSTKQASFPPLYSGAASGLMNSMSAKGLSSSFPATNRSVDNTILLSTEKPIVRAPRPQEFNQKLLTLMRQQPPSDRKRSNGYTDADRRRWITTSQAAADEYALPIPKCSVPESTLEAFADPVRYRARESGPRPCLWQLYTREWDMKQLRESPRKINISLPQIPLKKNLVQQREKEAETKQNVSARTSSSERQAFTRPMPGYRGFVPQYPVNTEPITDNDTTCSTSRRAYRFFSPSEYRYKQPAFAHKSPLSKTVTLTAPFNPFNKRKQSNQDCSV